LKGIAIRKVMMIYAAFAIFLERAIRIFSFIYGAFTIFSERVIK
jgi:hypothetical protein